jgi:hypothetical protein
MCVADDGMSRTHCARGGRTVLAVLFAGIFWLAAGSGTWGGSEQGGTVAQIYAGDDWYRARPEPEEAWRGVLRERDTPTGPATRTSLRYTLVAGGEGVPVYAAQEMDQLAPFVGHEVAVHGKLVDLSAEGFGKELWIGSIRKAE